jgi:hypothetical protein
MWDQRAALPAAIGSGKSMAHIVQFRTGIERAAPEPEASPDRSADIIIFPGVRRERHSEPSTGPSTGPSRWPDAASPERDILELPD